MKVVVHPDAMAELDEHASFSEARRARSGQALRKQVEALLRLVAEYPLLGRRARDGSRSIVMSRLPFRIVYLVTADAVTVVAIAHTSRAFGYWRGRR